MPTATKLPRRCACGPHVTMGGYQNQVTVPVPAHMAHYGLARVRAGLTPLISLDRCLVGEILSLWRKGIRTAGCCCGHNVAPPMINALTEEDGLRMLAMGYEKYPPGRHGEAEWTFYPRTIKPESV